MNKITERQKFILDKIIREYIRQAIPVSSEFLEQKYNIGIKPATVRLECKRLTELGYLEKPHISAGRIPTDKGYRFFVNEFLEKRKPLSSEEKLLEKLSILEEEIDDSLKFLSQLTRLLADFSSNLALIYLAEEMICLKEGWTRILKEPEFHDQDFAQEFALMIQKLEKNIERFLNGGEEFKIKVFIGKETKIPSGENFSLILGETKFPWRKRGALAILGPKRMHYGKNIRLINSLVKFLERW